MTIEIPKQLQNTEFRFVLLGKWNNWGRYENIKGKSVLVESKEFDTGEYSKLIQERIWKPLGKAPFETAWQNKGYRFDDEKLLKHLEKGGNYGVIGGYGNLRILDIDKEDLIPFFTKKFKDTFIVRTGSGKIHIYILSDYKTNRVLSGSSGEFRADNYQVVGCGSTHPNGQKYTPYNQNKIKEFSEKEISGILKSYIREEQFTESPAENKTKDTSRSGLEYRKVLALLREGKSREEIYVILQAYSKWSSAPEQYRTVTFENAENFYLQERQEKERTGISDLAIFGRWKQVEAFYKRHPYFYDKIKCWWRWNFEKYYYEQIDEIDILNSIKNLMHVGIIESSTRTEILNVLKQYGREKIPKEIKNTWIQFKSKIYDFTTDEIFDASPKFFFANPIMWDVGETENTPEIDKLFLSWVGEEHIIELYEIVAFCCVPDYFIHRILFFYGNGSNGKSTFDNLITKFFGEYNITTSSLERLIANSRFETAKFHKKLAVLMSEITADEIRKSDILKSASGQELIPGEIKNKNPFDFLNYAKILIPTNKIPKSTDDSDGFYRRIKIIDFPNQFQKEKDVLSNIPKEEFNNLAKKCLNIAKRLWKEKVFTNDGDFSQRRQRYEERTLTVLESFINRECIQEDVNAEIPFSVFFIEFSKFLTKNNKKTKTKSEVGKELKKLGWESKISYLKDGETNVLKPQLCVLGLKMKNTGGLSTI